ncbi:hypothetical protein V6N13_007582 [Hibiscus sabdariffa]
MVYTSLGAIRDDREGIMSIQNRGVRCQGPRVPGRFRSKRGTAWDQGVPAGSRSFQHGPGATGTREGFPDRPGVRQKVPGATGTREGFPDRPGVRQKDPGGSRSAGGTTRPIKARSASPAVGTSRPVLTVRRTGRPTPRSNYELFNCNNLNIRYWSWNYRGCWHQTCPPMDPR